MFDKQCLIARLGLNTILFAFRSRHMNFNFPYKEGAGLSKVMSHGSRECVQIVDLMCTYDPEERQVILLKELLLVYRNKTQKGKSD